MARKLRRIPQPPIDRDNRPSEARSWRVGGLLAILAVGLILVGALIVRRVEREGVEKVHEYELIRAATLGGLSRIEAADGGASTATQPAEARPTLKIKKAQDDDFCPT